MASSGGWEGFEGAGWAREGGRTHSWEGARKSLTDASWRAPEKAIGGEGRVGGRERLGGWMGCMGGETDTSNLNPTVTPTPFSHWPFCLLPPLSCPPPTMAPQLKIRSLEKRKVSFVLSGVDLASVLLTFRESQSLSETDSRIRSDGRSWLRSRRWRSRPSSSAPTPPSSQTTSSLTGSVWSRCSPSAQIPPCSIIR